jgi:hypothetical protein
MSELTLISGQVKQLKVQRISKSVFASSTPQKLAEAGALTAAALGSVYASTVMASSRLKMTQEVEIFSCEVNGVKLVGCLGEVTFMNHNMIEFVVEYMNEEKKEAIAHAARNPQKKVIWVAPYQEKGEIFHRKEINKASLVFPSVVLGGGLMIMLIMALAEGDNDFSYFSHGLGVGLIVALVMACFLKLIGRIDLKDVKQATKVLAAIGYQYPSEVDLSSNSTWINMELEAKTGKIVPEMPLWVYRYQEDDLTQKSLPSSFRNIMKMDKLFKEKYGAS